MSTISGTTAGTASVAYATNLARTSKIERSLYSLGNAIQHGDLTSAGATLSALMKAFPEFSSSSTDSSAPGNSLDQDFEALADAIASNSPDAAKSAWVQLKGDLARNGLTSLTNGETVTAQILAGCRASLRQAVLSSNFGVSADSSTSISALLGDNTSPANTTDALSALVRNWLTYKRGGTASGSGTTSTTGTNLDTSA